MKQHKFPHVVAIFFILCLTTITGTFAQQISTACAPYPCMPPADTNRETVVLDMPSSYETLRVKTGRLYKFYVVAGNVYMWNSGPSGDSTVADVPIKTKITLYYDDNNTFQTVITSSSQIIDYDGYAQAMPWRANYTGVVGFMLTCGDNENNVCETLLDTLTIEYGLARREQSKILVPGRNSITKNIECNNQVYTIFDSGSGSETASSSSHYSDNEDGCLVLYPGDVTSRLKLWGSSYLYAGDTLFIYDGVFSPDNPGAATLQTIVTGNDSWSVDNPVFLSGNAGDPITLRMKSDSSCTDAGLILYAKCCANTNLPENLHFQMISDSCGRLSWNPGEGTEIHYNWTLFDTINNTEITHGSTTDTSLVLCGLDANINYYFTVRVRSECSNEETEDVVVSDTNQYVYGISTSGNPIPGSGSLTQNVFGNGEINGTSSYTTTDPDGSTHAYLRICEGNAARICFSMPANLLDGENINVESYLRWVTNMRPIDHEYTVEGDHYVIEMHTNGTQGCWITEELHEDGYANVIAVTENGSTAQAYATVIVDTLPNIYITIDSMHTANLNTCMYDTIIMRAHGGYVNANHTAYCWKDSLNTDIMNEQRRLETIDVVAVHDNMFSVIGRNQHNCIGYDTVRIKVNPLPVLEYESDYVMCIDDSATIHVGGLAQYTFQRIDTVYRDTVITHTGYIDRRSDLQPFLQSIEMPSDSVVTITYLAPDHPNPDTLFLTPAAIDTFNFDTLPATFFNLLYYESRTDTLTPFYTIASNTDGIITLHPDIETDYYFFGTDTNGCAGEGYFHLSIASLPSVRGLISNNDLCPGESTHLSIENLNEEELSYNWWKDDDDSHIISHDSSIQIDPETSCIYHAIIYNGYGCDTILDFPIHVFDSLRITLTAVPQSICRNDASTLITTSSAPVSWQWADDSIPSAMRTVAPLETTEYHVSAIDSNGCTASSSTVVEVKNRPQPEYIPNDTICDNGTVNVSTSGLADRYYWFENNQLFDSTSSNLTIQPEHTSDYQLIYALNNGCQDTLSFNIAVYTFATPSISADTTICRGDSTTLTASGGLHFAWDNPAHSTTNSITVSPADTTTYSVYVYNFGTCGGTVSTTVNVIPFFELSITHSADTICQFDTVRLYAHGSNNYIWNTEEEDISIVHNLDSTSVFSVRSTNNFTNCSRTVYDTIVVDIRPQVQIIPSDTAVCHGYDLQLTAIGNAAYYVWNTGDTSDFINLNPTASSNYDVIAYTTFGCTSYDTSHVSVNPLPNEFNINAEDSICYGDSTLFLANYNPSIAIVEYHWNTAQASSNSNNFYYHPQNFGSSPYLDVITVSVEDENGCQRAASHTIKINPIPQDNIVSPVDVCIYDTLRLSLHQPYQQYHWTGSNIHPSNNAAEIWSRFTQAVDNTTFSVTVWNEYGCTSTFQKQVTVYGLPDVEITSLSSGNHFCEGQYYTFTASGASTYVWDNGATGSSITLIPTGSLISVTGTDNHNCKNSNNFLTNIVQRPDISLSVTDTLVCAYQTVSITASSPSYSDVQFIWNNAYPNATYTVESVTQNSNPIVECYRQHGSAHCSVYDTAHIRLRNLPSLHVIRNDGPTCVNEPGMVVVSGATDFQWDSRPYLTVIGHDTAIVSPWIGGNDSLLTFNVIGLDDIGCQSILPINYYVYPKPQVVLSTSSNDNSICANHDIMLYASGADRFQWYNENQFNDIISTNASWTLNSDSNRAFHVIGLTLHNCKDTSHISVTVYPNPSIDATALDDEICYGFATTLQGQCTIENVSYSWTNLSTLESHVGAEWNVNPDTTTTYGLLVTDLSTNCMSNDTKRIIVHYSPVVKAFVPHGVCHGDSITVQGQDAYTYNWYYPSLDSLIGESTNITLQPMELPITTYQMVGTDIYGCRDTISVPIHVNALPILSSHMSDPGYLCVGGDGMLGASVSGDIPYLLYSWSASPVDNNSLFLNDIAFLSPDTTTVYTITGSYTDYGVTCSSSIQDTLTVYPAPSVQIISEIDTICSGHSIILEGTGAEQYIWYCDGIIGAGSTLEISPMHNTSYILIGQDTNRCYARDTILINIAPNTPSAHVISDITPRCSQIPVEVVLSDTTYNYYWFPQTGLSQVSGNTATVTTDHNISYKVVYTNIYGCWDSLTVPITVLPLPPLQLTPDTAICEGFGVTLRAMGGSNYVWNDGLTTNYRSLVPTGDTTFSITAYNHFNCEKSDTVHITMIPKFDLEILTSRDSFCLEDNTTILTALGAGDLYYWSNGDNTSSIIVNPENTTSYVLTSYNSGTNCFSSDTVTITRFPDMPLHLNVSDTSICLDESITFNISPADYPWYQWDDGYLLSSRTATPEHTTTYYINATNNYGCLMRDSITVTVHEHPVVEIAATGTDACFGNSIQLSITGNATRYEWNNGSHATSLNISEVSDADYILTGYSEYGCITKDTAHAAIHATPHDTVWSSEYNICQNDTVVLMAAGLYNYQWTPQESVLNPQGNPAFAMPMSNTTYKAVYTDIHGCKDSATVHVDVRPSPVLDLTPSDTICAGDSVFIHVSGAYTYLWNTGSTASSFWVYPTHAETYTVAATNGFNCTTTGVVRLDYTPYFDLHLYSDKDTICVGDQVTLSYTGAADNYQWSTGSTQSHITVAPQTTSIYWLTAVNNASRCAQTLYDTVTVWQNPTLIARPDTIVCYEDSVCIEAISDHLFTYNWTSTPSCTFIGNPSGEQVCAIPQAHTTFIYHADNNWCHISDSIKIYIAPNPTIQYTVEPDKCGQCIGLIDVDAYSPANPVTIQWQPDVSSGFEATNLCEGMYTVTATDARGCQDQEIIVVDNLPAPVVEVSEIISQNYGDDGNITINVVSSTGTPSIHWYTNQEMTNELYQYADALSVDVFAGQYWISVEDENCRTTLYALCTYTTEDFDVWIPNAFNPFHNYNAIWKPIISDYAHRDYEYELEVYNRYGGLVFSTTEYEIGWNGNFPDGSKAPAGMYVYRLKVRLRANATKAEPRILKGSVLLIR